MRTREKRRKISQKIWDIEIYELIILVLRQLFPCHCCFPRYFAYICASKHIYIPKVQ